MRFADFIDRLVEIQNKYDCDDVEIDLGKGKIMLIPLSNFVKANKIIEMRVREY